MGAKRKRWVKTDGGGKMNCPGCGTECLENYNYCPSCGKKLLLEVKTRSWWTTGSLLGVIPGRGIVKIRFCRVCGRELEPGQDYDECPQCGCYYPLDKGKTEENRDGYILLRRGSE